jgi:hypothetical protein
MLNAIQHSRYWCTQLHRRCSIGAVGRTNAANVEWCLAFAKAIVAWCIYPAPSVQLGGQMPQILNGDRCVVHRPCAVGAIGRTNAANVEWRLIFVKAIIAWCIGPASSLQLGRQMRRMLNGVLPLLN